LTYFFIMMFFATYVASLASFFTTVILGAGIAVATSDNGPTFAVGDLVVAHGFIGDDDDLYASLGDFGTVVYVDPESKLPTVAFARTQKATIVGTAEVLKVVTG